MRATAIVEVEISADRIACFADGFVSPQVYLLIFDAAPQPLDEHVVAPCALAVHADGDAVAGEHAGVKAAPVNREPWAVLNISYLP